MRANRWVAAAGCAAVVLAGAGCSGRSAEAYCAELDAGYKKIQANMDAGGQDAMAGLGSIFLNFGEYTTMLHKMQDKAPEEISSDFDDAVKAWDAQADRAGEAASNPLGALASSFMASMMASASMQNVDRYTKEHCGRTVFGMGVAPTGGTGGTAGAGAVQTPEPTPSPTPTPLPENAEAADGMSPGGTVEVQEAGGVVALAADMPIGSHTATVTGGEGATVVSMFGAADRTPGLQYQVQTTGCAWGLGTTEDGSPVFVVQEYEERPASGLTEASTGEFVAAYDPRTGNKLWRTEWKGEEPFAEGAGCTTPDGGFDTQTMTFTDTGYMAFTSTVFNLADGSHRNVEGLHGAVGSWLLRSNSDTYDYSVLDPATLKARGRVGEPMQWRTPAVGPELVPTWKQDGSTLLAVRSRDDDEAIEVVALPTGKRVWKGRDEASGYQVVGVADNGDLVTTAGVFTPGGKRTFALTDSFDTCAVEGNEVYGVGGTLVALGASTGSEGRVDAQVTSCSTLPPVTSAGAIITDQDMVVFDRDSTVWDLLSTDR